MEYYINVAEPFECLGEIRYKFLMRINVNYGNVKRIYHKTINDYPDCKVTVYRKEEIIKKIDMNKCNY
ncbi:MAG: hypothetical protein ACLRVD_08420 [Blautia caecimuris]